MEPKKTALYDKHVEFGAKIVPFAGYLMPIQYSGILDEHKHVRSKAGVFDVSHMGEFEIRGENAEKFLNRMTTNNVARLEPGGIQYSAMLYDDGGIVDDLLVYRFEDHYLVVVNAANIEKDFNWLKEHLSEGAELKDISDDITLLAIQGPNAAELVSELADEKTDDIVYYSFREGKIAGIDAIISRTGYTGEDGFELYVRKEYSEKLWDALFEIAGKYDLKPVGLGARDSLRLEASYCLYGNDIDQTTNPIEARLGWIVKSKKKGGFIGKEPVLKAKEGVSRKLCGFALNGKGIARRHSEIYSDGQKVGYVTSGGISPQLDKSIGMAYIDLPYDKIGTELEIDVRNRRIPAEIVQLPFYKRDKD